MQKGPGRHTSGGEHDGGSRPELREWLVAGIIGIILALIAGTALRTFVLGAVVVPSRSMCNTVVPGDRVMVSKLVVPRTLSLPLPFMDGSYDVTLPPLRSIRIGDVVVAHPPECAGVKSEERTAYILKRCAGMPGDTLIFDGATLTVNGLHFRLPSRAVQTASPCVYLDEGTCDTVIVPEHSYFLLGDNPGESVDSRVWGPVPASSVVGVAAMVFWSVEPGEHDEEGGRICWDRIGMVIR
jgi:signal peptidase I